MAAGAQDLPFASPSLFPSYLNYLCPKSCQEGWYKHSNAPHCDIAMFPHCQLHTAPPVTPHTLTACSSHFPLYPYCNLCSFPDTQKANCNPGLAFKLPRISVERKVWSSQNLLLILPPFVSLLYSSSDEVIRQNYKEGKVYSFRRRFCGETSRQYERLPTSPGKFLKGTCLRFSW